MSAKHEDNYWTGAWDDADDERPAPKLFPNREGLRAFLKANNKELCEDCGCCDVVGDPCEQCGGDGVWGHDCGEDTCCCLDPEENEPCDLCLGRGYFKACIGCCSRRERGV